jgi:hypothetical protein
MDTTRDTSSQLIFSGAEFKQTLHGRCLDGLILFLGACIKVCVCVFTEVGVDCVMVYAVVIIKTRVSSVDVWSEKSNFRPTQSGQIRSQASSPKPCKPTCKNIILCCRLYFLHKIFEIESKTENKIGILLARGWSMPIVPTRWPHLQ